MKTYLLLSVLLVLSVSLVCQNTCPMGNCPSCPCLQPPNHSPQGTKQQEVVAEKAKKEDSQDSSESQDSEDSEDEADSVDDDTKFSDYKSQCAKHTWNRTCCQCIVLAISNGQTNLTTYNNSYNVGMFQINQIHWASCNKGVAPCNDTASYFCAKQIYTNAGNKWSPWSDAADFCGCPYQINEQIEEQL